MCSDWDGLWHCVPLLRTQVWVARTAHTHTLLPFRMAWVPPYSVAAVAALAIYALALLAGILSYVAMLPVPAAPTHPWCTRSDVCGDAPSLQCFRHDALVTPRGPRRRGSRGRRGGSSSQGHCAAGSSRAVHDECHGLRHRRRGTGRGGSRPHGHTADQLLRAASLCTRGQPAGVGGSGTRAAPGTCC